jgi:hypothetical protein
MVTPSVPLASTLDEFQYWRRAMFKRLTVVGALFLLGNVDVAAVAADASGSPANVMAHHIAVIKKDDVDGVIADYADDAVLVMPAGTFIGLVKIRQYFESLAAQHRDWSTYNVTQEVLDSGVVLQHRIETGGIEVFVVRNGKIVFQALQSPGQLSPPAKSGGT